MCSATDMRCAINDDHVRVVQLTSSSYCFLDNLSRTCPAPCTSVHSLSRRTQSYLFLLSFSPLHAPPSLATAAPPNAPKRVARRMVGQDTADPFFIYMCGDRSDHTDVTRGRYIPGACAPWRRLSVVVFPCVGVCGYPVRTECGSACGSQDLQTLFIYIKYYIQK